MFVTCFTSILFLFLQLPKGHMLQEAMPSHDGGKLCATVTLIYKTGKTVTIPLDKKEKFQDFESKDNLNITEIKANVTENCRLTLCNEASLMGLFCYEYLHDPSGSVDIESVAGDKKYLKFLKEAFRNKTVSSVCICEDDPENTAEAIFFWKNGIDKTYNANRNFVGVTFSANNDARTVGNYTETEVMQSLWLIASRFSQLSVYTHQSHPSGLQIEPIDLVLEGAAKINQKLNYLMLRISVIIANDEEVDKVLNAIDVANDIFSGTVWGITTETSEEYITTMFLEGIQEEVKERGKTVDMFNQIKFGIRANTFYETGLCPRDIAEPADYEICVRYLTTTNPSEEYFEKFHNEALQWRKYLHEAEVGLVKKVYVEAGLPSNGTWGESNNTVAGMQKLWDGMREFGEKYKYHVFMKEAFDQPWKEDFNKYYGWWTRNSTTHELQEKQPEPQPEIDETNHKPWYYNLDGLFGAVAVFTVAVIVVALWMTRRKYQKYRSDLKVLANEFIKGDPTASEKKLGDTLNGQGRQYLTAVRAPYDSSNEISDKDITIDKGSMRTSRDDVTVVTGSINMNNCKSTIFLKSTSPRSSLTSIKHLLNEIKIYSYLGPHVNVVGFMGAITTKIERGIVTLALEYCPLGDLRTFLNEKVDKSELEEKYCKIMIMNTGDEIYQDVGGFTTLSYFTAEDAILQENDENQSQGTGTGYGFSGTDYVSRFDALEPNNANASKNLSSTLTNIDLRQLYHWCLQIAQGLDFLSQRHIVHADIAARNCLLASIDLVKISDFGLSKRQYTEITLVTHEQNTPLPFKWMAPESIRSLVFSSRSDVWSFGVTVWEIFTLGEMPFEEASFDQHFVNLVESGSLRLGKPKYACKDLYDTMLQCWSSDPEKRPTFAELEKFFHAISTQ